MKTLYCYAVVNDKTGEVEHCGVSDSPLTRNMVELSADLDAPTIPVTYTHNHFTLSVDDGAFIRAKDLLPALKVGANGVPLVNSASPVMEKIKAPVEQLPKMRVSIPLKYNGVKES